MRLLIKKCRIGDNSRDIKFENSKDDWPQIYVEVSPNDYEDVITVPIETVTKLWEIVMRKKDSDKYLEDYDLRGGEKL